MTSGWGVDAKITGGVPVSGTTDDDVRKVWSALYSPGIISGCKITTSATAMQYSISSGVVAIKTATGETVLAPVQGTTISTPAAPPTGSRKDLIYVKQRFPDVEFDSEIEVGVATSKPDRSQVIGTYTVSAGQTNTNAAVNSGSVDYSIAYGASLGVLHTYQDTTFGPYPNALTRKGHGSFYVPTDRRIRFRLRTTMYSQGAVGFDNSKFVEYAFLPNLDGTDFTIWATPGLHQAWNTIMFEAYMTVPAGDHTVNYGQFRAGGTGTAVGVYGSIGGYIREGTVFVVEDAGAVV